MQGNYLPAMPNCTLPFRSIKQTFPDFIEGLNKLFTYIKTLTSKMIMYHMYIYLTYFFTSESKCQFVDILHWYKVCHPKIPLFNFLLICLDL